jgi:hypothetical protein
MLAEPPASSFPRERRSLSSSTACSARSRSPSFAARRAWPRASITAGRRNSTKLASGVWPVTPRGQRPAAQSRISSAKPRNPKKVVAEQARELRLLRISMTGDGGDVDAKHRSAMTHEVPRVRKARDHPPGRAVACSIRRVNSGVRAVGLSTVARFSRIRSALERASSPSYRAMADWVSLCRSRVPSAERIERVADPARKIRRPRASPTCGALAQAGAVARKTTYIFSNQTLASSGRQVFHSTSLVLVFLLCS